LVAEASFTSRIVQNGQVQKVLALSDTEKSTGTGQLNGERKECHIKEFNLMFRKFFLLPVCI